MTGELFGAKWKIKMDSYIPGVAIVDLKVMASITDLKWVKDIGYLDFVRYWGYDIQGAVYQEIVRQNTGEKLPFLHCRSNEADRAGHPHYPRNRQLSAGSVAHGRDEYAENPQS